jgi:hypothetical protein
MLLAKLQVKSGYSCLFQQLVADTSSLEHTLYLQQLELRWL